MISGDLKFCGNFFVVVCKDLDVDIYDVYFFCLLILLLFVLLFFDFDNNFNLIIFGFIFFFLEEDSLFEFGNYEVNFVVVDENGLLDIC